MCLILKNYKLYLTIGVLQQVYEEMVMISYLDSNELLKLL